MSVDPPHLDASRHVFWCVLDISDWCRSRWWMTSKQRRPRAAAGVLMGRWSGGHARLCTTHADYALGFDWRLKRNLQVLATWHNFPRSGWTLARDLSISVMFLHLQGTRLLGYSSQVLSMTVESWGEIVMFKQSYHVLPIATQNFIALNFFIARLSHVCICLYDFLDRFPLWQWLYKLPEVRRPGNT